MHMPPEPGLKQRPSTSKACSAVPPNLPKPAQAFRPTHTTGQSPLPRRSRANSSRHVLSRHCAVTAPHPSYRKAAMRIPMSASRSRRTLSWHLDQSESNGSSDPNAWFTCTDGTTATSMLSLHGPSWFARPCRNTSHHVPQITPSPRPGQLPPSSWRWGGSFRPLPRRCPAPAACPSWIWTARGTAGAGTSCGPAAGKRSNRFQGQAWRRWELSRGVRTVPVRRRRGRRTSGLDRMACQWPLQRNTGAIGQWNLCPRKSNTTIRYTRSFATRLEHIHTFPVTHTCRCRYMITQYTPPHARGPPCTCPSASTTCGSTCSCCLRTCCSTRSHTPILTHICVPAS